MPWRRRRASRWRHDQNQGLAYLCRQPVQAIGATSDVVRASIPSSFIVGDTIPLRVAADYAASARNLLATVAHTEMWPVLMFPRVGKAALEYANHCRFGHTFRGSFGFAIGSPLGSLDPTNSRQTDPSVPLARRVVERFVRGVAGVCSVINGDDESVLMENAEHGFGANGYRRFADVIESTAGNEIILSFAFSPEWKLPPDLQKAEAFSIGRKHLELSKSVAETLRKRHETQLTASLQASMGEDDLSSDDGHTTTLIGEVVRLARADQAGNVADIYAENEIAVQWQRREFGTVRIWIPLSGPDYRQALEAHRTRQTVRVRGTLSRNGQFWSLLNPEGFTII